MPNYKHLANNVQTNVLTWNGATQYTHVQFDIISIKYSIEEDSIIFYVELVNFC